MNFEVFHFSQSIWLWGLLAIPFFWLAFFLFNHTYSHSKHLEEMIDPHLLPFLLVNKNNQNKSAVVFKLLALSLVWGCLVLALAGPRWHYREIEMMSKEQNLVILIDLSASMDATDVKPSRLIRARQKIEDLIKHSQGIKIGLIAFAADPHMIAPLTEDKETIRHLLPSLSTDLVYIQGSRLSPALNMASRMLEAETGPRTLIIISDGGFEDKGAINEVKKMAERGIEIHSIGIGTIEGSLLQDSKGNLVKKEGKAVFSRLERATLQEVSKAGKGLYIEPSFSNHDELEILTTLQSKAENIDAGKKVRFWDEGFIFFIIPMLPFFLYWFRKGFVFAIIALIPSFALNAGIMQEYFMNPEEAGASAFARGDYVEAAQLFQDAYRKGVAYYKAGHYEEAEKLFKQSTRPEVERDAGYNSGNALTQQQKFQEAIKAYEKVLEKWPDHQSTRENLELVKKMLEQQKQEDKQNEQEQDPKDDKEENKNQDQKSEKPSEQDEKEDPTKNESSSNKDGSDQNDQKAPPQEKELDNNQQNDKGNDHKDSAHQTRHDNEEQENGSPNEGANIEDSEKEKQEQNEEAGRAALEQSQKSQKDQDADVWLNRLTNDPKKFLKNKFYIESKNNATREGIDPW